MNHNHLLPLLCLGALAAQQPTKPPMPPGPGQLRITAPVHDVGPDGTLWTAGPDYVAHFDQAGAAFTPFLGSDAEREWPVTMALSAARSGEVPLAVRSAQPVRNGDVVRFDRGCAYEQYELRADGMEQRFVFESLPNRAGLQLRIAVTSDLVVTSQADGILLTGPRGGVHYGRALAIDGRGRQTPMTTELVDGGLQLTVPAEFVADAVLPLIVDPLVTTVYTFNSAPVVMDEVDYAYDAVAGEWLAIWEYAFSANNYNVYALRMGQDAFPVAAVVTIDSTSTSWRRPRVSHLSPAHRFLVVAECDNGSVPWIGGRIAMISNGVLTAGVTIDIARSGLNNAPIGAFTNPDVGGDGAASGTGYWTVAFEYGVAPDRDVHVRQVAYDGTLIGNHHTLVAATSFDERGPRISKSNGQGAPGSQRWAVCYERRINTTSGDAAKLWLALVNRDGSLRSLFGQTTWILSDNSVTGRGGWDVSSPTDDLGGGRWLLAVESRPTATQGLDLFGIPFSDVGTGGVSVDISALENLAPNTLNKNQRAPVVDSDGTRFAVGYVLDYSATDSDVYLSTFAPTAGGGLVVHDAGIGLGTSTQNEDQPVVCSRRSGGGTAGQYLVGCHVIVNGEHRLRSSVYAGLAAGTIGWRNTACGGLSMTTAGTPGLALPITFSLSGVQGIGGFLAGSPASIPIAPCPGCTSGTSIDVLIAGNDWTFLVPNNTAIVGLTLAVQGFEIAATGPCFNQIRLSNTVDAMIR